MSTHSLRPWTELVKLHPDVEAGNLAESVYAIDLGAIAERDPNVPVVNRDAEPFFRATYLTADMRKMLEEVLASLAGKTGHNRVIKLRTPFGGGKSHTLAALLHAARSPEALHLLPEAQGLERPVDVRVAVFDGEKFGAQEAKPVGDGQTVQTMWGWLAWQIDPDNAYPMVAEHDRNRVSPGGDLIKRLLTEGAGNRPVLILLDEFFKYIERAGAVAVLDSTLQRQAKDFFQNLTVEVAGSTHCAMVFSLAWSSREALGNVGLLAEIDKLAARVDQLREPVTGEEVLHILHRRLLGEKPKETHAAEIASTYADVVTSMRRSHAETATDTQRAEEEGAVLRERLKAYFPFHPALIDLMRERWASLDAYQRTRGALRFLATCLHSLKHGGGASPLLGPGNVPLGDVNVRVKMLKELGAQNDYDAVIQADIVGPNARAGRIDARLAQENPAYAHLRPATRLATAILTYSFGGLKRNGEKAEETLPPGVTEQELLASCLGPELDSITAGSVLSDLRNSCLYLHYDGVRYCFKTDPNVTKLIEDAEQSVSREESQAAHSGPVRGKIKDLLDQKLAGQPVEVWPAKSQDIPDEEPRFLVAYLPMEFATYGKAEQEKEAQEFLSKYGDRPRRYRNGIGLAVPEKRHIEALRRAVRYLIAIERVETKKTELRLSKNQIDMLREQKRTRQGAAESSFRELYAAVWLPRVISGNMEIEKVERGGRPLQASEVHERIMELLTSSGAPKVHGSVTPGKIAERVKLGEAQADGQPRLGIKAKDVLEAFYRDIAPPRLESGLALQKGIVRGISEGHFGYFNGATPQLGDDGKYQISLDRVRINVSLVEDEVDFDSGFLIHPSAIPAPPAVGPGGEQPVQPPEPGQPDTPAQPGDGGTQPTPGGPGAKTSVALRFKATRDQIFKAFPAIANLADKSDEGKVTVEVTGTAADGYEPSWYRNAVQEPLEEADIEEE